jgi:CBS domain-containing protein
MSVKQICQRNVDLAELGESVQAVAERMRQRMVGCLVVVDGSRKPIGIVTDRDLALRVVADGKNPYATRIDEAMTANITTIRERTDLEQALRLMRNGVFRRLPVVDDDGKLVGIVTLDDILMLLTEELGGAGQVLDRETPQRVAIAS